MKPKGLPLGSWERDEGAVAWIYGSILTGAAVAVAASVVASRSYQVALYTALTLVIVWLAHSYAAFVGHGGRIDIPGVLARVRHALDAELPVVVSASPTIVATGACALLGADVTLTGFVGLFTAIVTMAIVAGVTARRAEAGWGGVAAAAAGALVLGIVLVAAKVALK